MTNHQHSRSCGCDITTLVYDLLERTEEIMAAQDTLNALVVSLNDAFGVLEQEIQTIKDGNVTLDFAGVDKVLARLRADVTLDAPPAPPVVPAPVDVPPVVTPPVTSAPVDVPPVVTPTVTDVPPTTPEVPVGA